jgi:hypothetical protein|tara:strand:- start:14121 stop:14729 length:609 start_codon:yes stop_codon:yes gene_type:complete
VLNKRTVLPITYLGPIKYYALLLNNPDSEIESNENYVKQTIRNRCNILSANGILSLTIPKQRSKNSKTIIKDIKICYKQSWQKNHWNSIKSSYSSSPFFEFYMDDLKLLFSRKEKYLFDFNINLQEYIIQELNLKNSFKISTQYIKNDLDIDFRENDFKINKQNEYDQVFDNKFNFSSNLSIIDLLFNLGPQARFYLEEIKL